LGSKKKVNEEVQLVKSITNLRAKIKFICKVKIFFRF